MRRRRRKKRTRSRRQSDRRNIASHDRLCVGAGLGLTIHSERIDSPQAIPMHSSHEIRCGRIVPGSVSIRNGDSEMARQRSVTFIVSALLGAASLLSCGGGSGGVTGPSNPIPAIEALSPNSSQQGGSSFTLSVVGSNFISGSGVQWNGNGLATTFVSSALITASVPASAIASAGPASVTVVNPAPGGGASAALNFAVPCVIPSPATASTQTAARVGAYYFDGWSGPLTNFHFQGLPLGPYQDRQPFSAWQDSSTCAVEQQLATAHNFGIDFFVFDWYFNVQVNDPGENLNSALEITQALPNRHGMQFAILYVDGAPFDVQPADWTTAVNQWVGYMTDPAYAQVNGEPVFFIINVGEMRQVFGTPPAVAGALHNCGGGAGAGSRRCLHRGRLRSARRHDGTAFTVRRFFHRAADGYDAIALYNYPFAPPPVNGMVPFSTLSDGRRVDVERSDPEQSTAIHSDGDGRLGSSTVERN